MEMLHVILWMIYPYTVVAILGMGLVWQYDSAKVFDDPEVELLAGRLLTRTVKGLLFLSLLSGIAIFVFYGITNEPEQLFQWVVSLIHLRPDMDLIMGISALSKAHLLLMLTFLLFLSFTKYVSYLFQPHKYVKAYVIKRTKCE